MRTRYARAHNTPTRPRARAHAHVQVPDVEWWDANLLPHGYACLDEEGGLEATLAAGGTRDQVTHLVQHPIELRPPAEPAQPPALPVMLTKKEQKKMRALFPSFIAHAPPRFVRCALLGARACLPLHFCSINPCPNIRRRIVGVSRCLSFQHGHTDLAFADISHRCARRCNCELYATHACRQAHNGAKPRRKSGKKRYVLGSWTRLRQRSRRRISCVFWATTPCLTRRWSSKSSRRR
jgi:hypothetical protein